MFFFIWIIAQHLRKHNNEIAQIVSSSSGESDSVAEGAEGFADDEGRINFAEGYLLLFKGSGPVSVEDRISLPVHVAVVFIPTIATKQGFAVLLLAS